jgi:ribosomal protein S14
VASALQRLTLRLGAVRATRGRARGRERCNVLGQPRLQAAELEVCRAIVSAAIGKLPDGRPERRRPDLVRFPARGAGDDRSRAVARPGGGRRRSATEGALEIACEGRLLRPLRAGVPFPVRFGR